MKETPEAQNVNARLSHAVRSRGRSHAEGYHTDSQGFRRIVTPLPFRTQSFQCVPQKLARAVRGRPVSEKNTRTRVIALHLRRCRHRTFASWDRAQEDAPRRFVDSNP